MSPVSPNLDQESPGNTRVADTPSAAQDLPFDVLSNILVISLTGSSFSSLPSDHVRRERFTELKTSKPPWTFSYVSRSWRDAAVSTSLLWSRIIADFWQGPNLALLEICLERSSSRDLDLDISFAVIDRWEESRMDGVQTLLSCSQRWKSVDIDLRLPDGRNPLLHPNHSKWTFDSLQSLGIRNTSLALPDHVPLRLDRSPSLSALFLTMPTQESLRALVSFHLPWAQITFLEIGGSGAGFTLICWRGSLHYNPSESARATCTHGRLRFGSLKLAL